MSLFQVNELLSNEITIKMKALELALLQVSQQHQFMSAVTIFKGLHGIPV